jgi:hypothetical protein
MATVKKASRGTATATSKKATAKKAPSKKAATIDCGKWAAWHDFMPGKTPTLYVTGVCKTPTPGYKIKLELAEPQGINPKILLLRKVVTPPTKPQAQVITTVEVRFTKKTKFEYTHVTILPDEKTVKVRRVV